MPQGSSAVRPTNGLYPLPLLSLLLTLREGIVLHSIEAFMMQTGTKVTLHSLYGVTHRKAHVFNHSDAVK